MKSRIPIPSRSHSPISRYLAREDENYRPFHMGVLPGEKHKQATVDKMMMMMIAFI